METFPVNVIVVFVANLGFRPEVELMETGNTPPLYIHKLGFRPEVELMET